MIESKSKLHRLYEILPGALIWVTFILVIILSFFRPIWAIIFVIAFDFYWLLKVLYTLIWLLIGWRKYRQAIKADWLEELKKLKPEDCPNNLKNKNHEDFYHLIFLPTLREPFEIIDNAFKALCDAKYDSKKFIVVLTGEEIDKDNYC